MPKDDKRKKEEDDAVVDLAARIGARQREQTRKPEKPADPPVPTGPPPEPPTPTRYDAPIPAPPKPRLVPARADREQRELIKRALAEEDRAEPAIPSHREAPGPGEIDLVVTPLPTADDWHRFELAVRKVRGVGQLRTEYYRHGVLKVRVSYQGAGRLATALRGGVPGYRVRVIGEDRTTLQILVASEADERRPG